MDERTNKSPPEFYRTLSPLGPLPCLSFQFTTMQSRGTGIADHILPLGDLLNVQQALTIPLWLQIMLFGPEFGPSWPYISSHRPHKPQPKILLTTLPSSPRPETMYFKTLIKLKRSEYIFKTTKNCPVWNHRSSTPPGPLPHYLNTTIPNDINGASGTADHNLL